MWGVDGPGILWAGRTEPEVQYTGDFYREDQEAQELLTLVRTSTVSSRNIGGWNRRIFICQREQPGIRTSCDPLSGFSEQERNWCLSDATKLSYTKQETGTTVQ